MSVLDPAQEGVVTVERDAEVIEISETMNDERIGSVVDEDGQLKEIVSLDDVIATSAEETATVIEEQSPGYAPDER